MAPKQPLQELSEPIQAYSILRKYGKEPLFRRETCDTVNSDGYGAMTPVLPRQRRPKRFPLITLPNWSWQITWLYLGFVLFLPLGGIFLKAAGVGPAGFWEAATSPEAVATYKVSFGLAFLASILNGVFGLVIAWALIRCRFPGQKVLDALIDLPFALPTAVAGLALTAVYSQEGWLGGSTLQPVWYRSRLHVCRSGHSDGVHIPPLRGAHGRTGTARPGKGAGRSCMVPRCQPGANLLACGSTPADSRDLGWRCARV